MADITYVPTWTGLVYLAIVLDVFSRRIVGWAMATHLRTELVLGALNMAIGQRSAAPKESFIIPTGPPALPFPAERDGSTHLQVLDYLITLESKWHLV